MNKSLPQGWTHVSAISEDGSSRRYSRIQKNHVNAILMEMTGDTPGHRMEDFVRIGAWLNEIGLKAPEIYEGGSDYLILEDFGDVSFKKALQSERPEKLYALAADILQHLRKQDCPLELPDYFLSHVHKGQRRIIDWYIPAIKQKINPDGLVESYLQAWAEVEKKLPPAGQGFLHIDFHVENLMYLPEEAGLKQCGILDFQGAMRGPFAYDLGNLLEDARMDVPVNIRNEILKKQDEDFRSWYRVMTTQFHARLLGQFIKMSLNGKPQYMQYMPRVSSYMKQGLQDPILKPVQLWFAEQGIDFEETPQLHNLKDFIRPDAF